MTIPTITRRAAGLLLAILPTITAPAQDVCLSEVHPGVDGQWIELHNRSAQSVDLSNYTLHLCTLTPTMPQNYWWPFPAGTVLPAGAYLRVNWFQQGAGVPQPGELFTGTTAYDFLFGLGGEALQRDAGAVALLSSQSNELMNSSSIFRDWVSWGANGFPREFIAADAGLWNVTRHVPAPSVGASIARDPDIIDSVVFPDEAWFVDFSPTPGLPNVTGAIVQPYGDACTLPGNHLLGLPQLGVTSLPLVGNGDFGIQISNTTGIYGEFVLIGFSAAMAPSGLPSILPQYSGVGCHEAIDTTQLVATWLLPATILQTTVPMPLDGYGNSLIGAELHAQALVIELLPFSYPPYQGLTNALRVVVGQ